MATTMLPAPDLLPDVLPTDRLTASGRPLPHIRAELRHIDDRREVLTVAGAWAFILVLIVGAAGPEAGLWSKRGSIVALGRISIPATYRYACTYQPAYLRLVLTRLRTLYGLPIKPRHLSAFFRRYSGDLADLGRGEILEWTAK